MTMTIDRKIPALLLMLGLAACGGGDAADERRTLGAEDAAPAQPAPGTAAPAGGQAERSPLPPEAQTHLDAGNAAYRAKDYAGALTHYREAARIAPDQAATWFGVTMAAEKTGDRAALDSARARIEALSPGLGDAHSGDAPAPSGDPHPAIPPAPPSGGR
jgi:tetratricopeptide (TPR) repeat protein